MKKFLYIIPALLAVATTFTSCHNTRRTVTTRTYVVGSGSSSTIYGYAPSSVAGRRIKCGNLSYTFNGGGNSFRYRGSLISYVKTGRNTASIYDYDDGIHHRITFTSPYGGYTASGRSVTLY